MTKRYPTWVSHQAWLMFNLNTDSLVPGGDEPDVSEEFGQPATATLTWRRP